MNSRIVAIAVLTLIALGGASLAQSNAPAVNETPTRTTTPSGAAAPTVSPNSPDALNPGVNPDAAGLQRGWRGYGASQQKPAQRPQRRDNGLSDSGR